MKQKARPALRGLMAACAVLACLMVWCVKQAAGEKTKENGVTETAQGGFAALYANYGRYRPEVYTTEGLYLMQLHQRQTPQDDCAGYFTAVDTQSGRETLLCNVPGCAHADRTCTAYVSRGETNQEFGGRAMLFAWADSVYFCTTTDKGDILYRMGKDGTGRRRLLGNAYEGWSRQHIEYVFGDATGNIYVMMQGEINGGTTKWENRLYKCDKSGGEETLLWSLYRGEGAAQCFVEALTERGLAMTKRLTRTDVYTGEKSTTEEWLLLRFEDWQTEPMPWMGEQTERWEGELCRSAAQGCDPLYTVCKRADVLWIDEWRIADREWRNIARISQTALLPEIPADTIPDCSLTALGDKLQLGIYGNRFAEGETEEYEVWFVDAKTGEVTPALLKRLAGLDFAQATAVPLAVRMQCGDDVLVAMENNLELVAYMMADGTLYEMETETERWAWLSKEDLYANRPNYRVVEWATLP